MTVGVLMLVYFTFSVIFATSHQKKLISNVICTRAGSGISGSRIPESWLEYPNPILSTGTRKIALWEVLNINEIYKMIKFK